jgi:hypothetical protein
MWFWAACGEPVELSPSTTLEPDRRWEPLAPLPAPRQECGVAVFEGRVVVVGGYEDDAFVDEVWAWEPARDAWTALPPLPRAVHHPNVAVLGDGLHVAGALVEGFAELSDHWVLAPGADAWTDATPLPEATAVGAAGAAVLDGRLHLVGGLHGTATAPFHQVFDPAAGGWERLPDAPTARDHFALAAVGGALVAAAGRADGIDAFTPGTDVWDGAWRAGAPIPTPRGGVMAAVDDEGRLHVVGGEGNALDPDGVFGAHEVYDPAADAWSTEPPMAEPRHGTGGAWLDGALHVPGGAPVLRFGATAVHDRWVP